MPFLPAPLKFAEPCGGNGALIRHLSGHDCVFACDWEPQGAGIVKMNALEITAKDLNGAQAIITNPPWGRDLLHPMIRHFSRLAPTWLLFDSDWAYTGQAAPFLPRCAYIVAVGRVKWIEGSASSGMDNCSWYKFVNCDVQTIFVGKKEKNTCDNTVDLFESVDKA